MMNEQELEDIIVRAIVSHFADLVIEHLVQTGFFAQLQNAQACNTQVRDIQTGQVLAQNAQADWARMQQSSSQTSLSTQCQLDSQFQPFSTAQHFLNEPYSPQPLEPARRSSGSLFSREDAVQCQPGQTLRLARKTIITPLAAEELAKRRINVTRE